CQFFRDIHSFPTRRSSDLDEDPVVVLGAVDPVLGQAADAVTVPSVVLIAVPGGRSVFDETNGVGDDVAVGVVIENNAVARPGGKDRKSTRLNSSHVKISYA